MELPISRLNEQLESFKVQLVDKVKYLNENAQSLGKESMDSLIDEIKDLQSTIQFKTNEFFNSVSENAVSSSYTPEEVQELSDRIRENMKNITK